MVILFGNNFIVSNWAVISLSQFLPVIINYISFCFFYSYFLFETILCFSFESCWLISGVDDLSDGKTFSLIGKFNSFDLFPLPELGVPKTHPCTCF